MRDYDENEAPDIDGESITDAELDAATDLMRTTEERDVQPAKDSKHDPASNEVRQLIALVLERPSLAALHSDAIETAMVGASTSLVSTYRELQRQIDVLSKDTLGEPDGEAVVDAMNTWTSQQMNGVAAEWALIVDARPKGALKTSEADGDIRKIARRRKAEADRKADKDRGASITNWKRVQCGKDDNGKPKYVTVPKRMHEVIGEIQQVLEGGLRRVDSGPFVHDTIGKPGTCEVDWLLRPAQLFGFLQSRAYVQLKGGPGYPNREEIHAEIARTVQHYNAVERLPHEPKMPGHYYCCPDVVPGDGRFLQGLLDRLSPATPIDRDLMLAAMMTQFWGGAGGTRPGFVVTSLDGRGAGKSKTAMMLTLPAGGAMEFGAKDEMKEIKARLLSPEGQTMRNGSLDNIKTPKFSWGEFEGMITSPVISGKRMYVGEGHRPNTVCWFITLNGANLSTDMAQRVIPIHVKRPTYSGSWEDDTRAYIEANRPGIIADIIGALRCEPFKLTKFMRWGSWERAVLARLPDPVEAQAIITERQGTMDVDTEEADTIEDYFASQLRWAGLDSDTADVHIPVEVAARWHGWATGEKQKTTAVSRALMQMIDEGKLRRIKRNPCRTYGRGFVWRGKDADAVYQTTRYDLPQLIADATARKRQDDDVANYATFE